MQFQKNEGFSQKRSAAAEEEGEVPLCKHNEAAAKRTSNTSSNPNRDFWCCPRPKADGCGFFKWCDGITAKRGRPSAASTPAVDNERLDRIDQKLDEILVNQSIIMAAQRGAQRPIAQSLSAYSQQE